MRSIRSVALLLTLLSATSSTAFVTTNSPSPRLATSLAASSGRSNSNESDNQVAPTSRRGFFQTAGLSLVAAAVVTAGTRAQPASATYSAYTHREQDWQERLEKGEVKISTARDLRRQLREIAPMNDEGSKIFCPNGTSSAVSPMMENKCSDREAIPSVYGRTQDVVGNSIPGFAGGRYTANMPAGGPSGSIAADIGGFPSYNAKQGRANGSLLEN